VDYYNPDFIKTDWRKENKFHDDDFILIYAGIIGHAQGLEVILHAANLLRNERDIKFIILGSGPEREKLINLKTEMNLDNVLFLETILKKDMSSIIKAVDVSIIPLRKIDLFKGAIPSKIFESLAMKKPALLGVEGEAKELFIDQGKCGLFFEPENAEDLSEKILELYSNNELRKELGENGRDFVMKKFNRDILAENFWNYLSGQK
jgi:glycosyltransferase involved in cell wall biosynthesis